MAAIGQGTTCEFALYTEFVTLQYAHLKTSSDLIDWVYDIYTRLLMPEEFDPSWPREEKDFHDDNH